MTDPRPRALIAVDGSDLSLRAARRGLVLLDAAVLPTVLTVVRPVVTALPAGEAIAIPPAVTDEITEEELDRARSEVDAVVRVLGVDAETRVAWGDPGPTIC